MVVSTGKSDWIHSVGDDKATLAGQLETVASSAAKGKAGGGGGLLGKLGKKLLGGGGDPAAEKGSIKGVFGSSAARTAEAIAAAAEAGAPGKLTVLNSSFLSSAAENDHQSVLVFPDFKVVHDVPGSAEGAAELEARYLAAGVGRAGAAGAGTLRSWPLPYHAVVLMCSHKKRDARCSQAAPILLAQVSFPDRARPIAPARSPTVATPPWQAPATSREACRHAVARRFADSLHPFRL